MFLAIVLVVGTFALASPSSMKDVQAQQGYDGTYNNYENDYGKDNNYKSKDNKIVKKINCNNINVNANGLELNVLPPALANLLSSGDDEEERDASSYGSYDGSEGQQSGYDNNKNSFKFVCINNNNNTLIGGEEEQPIPPTPPTPPIEPTTASLTVKKQVFGCAEFDSIRMTCSLPNGSPAWLDCNDNPTISGTEFCISLPKSIFDIEVLDEQDTQIQQFEGSEQGTTIENLEPGTYTVNEIIHPSNINQLGEDASVAGACTFSLGFSGGGEVLNTTTNILYSICFEYEDEQGNDCSTITLAAGKERTCIVKNYIGTAFNRP